MEISRHHDAALKQLWRIKTTVTGPDEKKKRKEKKFSPATLKDSVPSVVIFGIT